MSELLTIEGLKEKLQENDAFTCYVARSDDVGLRVQVEYAPEEDLIDKPSELDDTFGSLCLHTQGYDLSDEANKKKTEQFFSELLRKVFEQEFGLFAPYGYQFTDAQIPSYYDTDFLVENPLHCSDDQNAMLDRLLEVEFKELLEEWAYFVPLRLLSQSYLYLEICDFSNADGVLWVSKQYLKENQLDWPKQEVEKALKREVDDLNSYYSNDIYRFVLTKVMFDEDGFVSDEDHIFFSAGHLTSDHEKSGLDNYLLETIAEQSEDLGLTLV